MTTSIGRGILAGVLIPALLWGGTTRAQSRAGQTPEPAFGYTRYVAVLNTVVNDRGRVNYRALKAQPEGLNAFLKQLASLDKKTYAGWPRNDKIAFWINAYNAITLKAIINHYPIRSRGFIASRRYPRDSIRQIPGVWTKLRFRVMGQPMTLDEIEHKTLRPQFNEPRIHVALVCAAKGCPRLLNRPYEGNKLAAQFDEQIANFLSNRDKFAINRDKKVVYLSSIFKWFGEDFTKPYHARGRFSAHSKEEAAVLSFIFQYVSQSDAGFLVQEKYKIKYLDYDWSLNER